MLVFRLDLSVLSASLDHFLIRVYIDACSPLDVIFSEKLARKSKFICNFWTLNPHLGST